MYKILQIIVGGKLVLEGIKNGRLNEVLEVEQFIEQINPL